MEANRNIKRSIGIMPMLPLALLVMLFPLRARAQVYSGSDGSDAALDFSSISYTTNIVIDMHDHTNGVYQYFYVDIPTNVTVSFVTNASDSPVTWLVQSNAVIDGSVNIAGHGPTGVPYPNRPCYQTGGVGGPGGYGGGNGGQNGLGPGGGISPGAGGYGTVGGTKYGGTGGQTYGNTNILPLVGGSGGGGGGYYSSGGGGGGGAILIAASGTLQLNGLIEAGGSLGFYSGGGSGGAIKLVASNLAGSGKIDCGGNTDGGGQGRVRIGTFQNTFTGTISGVSSFGFDSGTNMTIIHQPISQTSSPGSNVAFTVGVYGVAPLFFQWNFFNTPISGATNQSLLLTNINPEMIGDYSVTISNMVKTVVSSNATLTLSGSTILYDGTIPTWWRGEYGLSLTDPTLATNYPPGDKLTYLQKYLYGLNPLTNDTDGDGLSDYDELFVYHTDPLSTNTSGDGIPDGWKVQYGLNPLIADANDEAGFDGVTYMQVYQYDLIHTNNQLNPNTPFALGSGFSNYELINNGQHTNKFYYDHENRLLGTESSRGISIGYQYDGNGNLVRQAVLPRASETNGLPLLWLWLNGLTNQPGIAYDNSSGSGWDNYQAYLAGVNPNDPTNQPDLLNNPGVNIGSFTFPFTPSNCVVVVGQLDNSGADEIVVGADGNATGTTNSLYILKEGFDGWSVQQVAIGPFGVTSLAIGQPANRPAPAIYAGLRQTGGTGKILELMNVGGVWQTNVVATSTNSAAFVLGVRSNLDLLASYAPTNGIDGALYSIAYSTNWNSSLLDTNTSHRGLGLVASSQSQLNNGAIRLLDTGGIAAGTQQISDLIPGLVSYWKLDESSGNAEDSFGTNTLINNNGVTFDSGLIQNCADFGSSNTDAYLSTGKNLGISAATSCSYSLWVKMNSEINSGIQGFGSLLFSDGIYLIIQYQYNGGSRGLNFYYGRGGVGNFSNFYLTTLGASMWHHLVFTYNSSSGEIRGYLDDNAVIDYTNNSPITSTYNFENLFSLGSGWDSGSVDHFASCKIDEVGIWSNALSSAEVNLLYGNGFGLSYSPLSLLSEPPATNRYLWRGLSLAVGSPRAAYTNGASVFYAYVDDNDGNGQIDAGDDFVLAEYEVNGANTNTDLLTLSRIPIASVNTGQSYGLASVNFLNTSNQVLFTAEPDGNIFAWTATNGTAPLQRQLFSDNYAGKAWDALTKVKTLEPGEGLAGLMVDPTNQNTCNVIFWPPQAVLPTPIAGTIETAPYAAVLPSSSPLGSNAVVTVRLWDNEGNASTPFLQYQILGSTNWQDATLTMLDGSPYTSSATRVAAVPSGSDHLLTWNALADVGANRETNVLLRARAQDFMLVGDWSQPTPFQLNTTVATVTNPTNTPVNFTGIAVVPGGIRFDWQGGSNQWLYLQSSPALAGTNANWVNVWTGVPPMLNFGSYTDFFGTNQMEFYRLKAVSP